MGFGHCESNCTPSLYPHIVSEIYYVVARGHSLKAKPRKLLMFSLVCIYVYFLVKISSLPFLRQCGDRASAIYNTSRFWREETFGRNIIQYHMIRQYLIQTILEGLSYGLWSRRWSPLSWIEHKKIFFNVHFQLKADTLINQYNFTFYRLSLLPKGEFKGKLLFVYVLGQFASKEISSLLDFVLHFWWWLREVKAFKPLNHDLASSLSLQIWSRWIKTRLETTSTNTVLNLIDMDKGEKMY